MAPTLQNLTVATAAVIYIYLFALTIKGLIAINRKE